MPASRYLVVVATVAVLCGGARSARADDDPRKVRAEAVFQEGVKLQAQGRSADALAKLKQAHEIYPSPNTLAGIARVEQAMGRSLDAIRHYREALRNPLTHPENAEYAKRAIAELEKQLARVDVRGPAGLSVRIDGRDFVLPLVEPLDVQPSALVLRGKLADADYEGRATTTIGQTTTLTMEPVGSTTPVASTSVTSGERPPRDEPGFWTTGRIVGATAFGVGVAGLAVGIVFGASSNSEADRADGLAQRLGPAGCPVGIASSECAELRDARDAQDRNRTISGVALVSGGVLAAAGLVTFFVSAPKASAALRVSPAVATGGLGMSLQGRF